MKVRAFLLQKSEFTFCEAKLSPSISITGLNFAFAVYIGFIGLTNSGKVWMKYYSHEYCVVLLNFITITARYFVECIYYLTFSRILEVCPTRLNSAFVMKVVQSESNQQYLIVNATMLCFMAYYGGTQTQHLFSNFSIVNLNCTWL